MSKFKTLEFFIGESFVVVEKYEESSITFTKEDGTSYEMYHEQDCCESVFIEDVSGNLNDLIGSPILKAEVRYGDSETLIDPDDSLDDSNTWTFFELSTIKGSVTIRWWGSSNGYYGEDVDIFKVVPNKRRETVHRAYEY